MVRTVGDVRKALSCVNAASASSVQVNFSHAFSSLKKGSPPPSQDIKRLRAAMHPMSFYTYFTFLGGRMSRTALTLEGFGLMPSRLTMFERSLFGFGN